MNDEFSTFSFLTDLDSIYCPVILIGGTGDPLDPPTGLQELASAFSKATTNIELIENSGNPVYEANTAVTDAVKNFIKSI
jgi:pimeloyl-ACP methyl ester carboxylesterase